MKTYSYAGVSKRDGKFKVRYANSSGRVKVLIKNDHSSIDMVEVKTPGSKEDALRFLLLIDFADGNPDVDAALRAEAIKRKVCDPAV